jgi:hypothetical protein
MLLIAPFDFFESNSFVDKLPYLLSAGCLIQLVALFFARNKWTEINFPEKTTRKIYLIILSVSFTLTILWIIAAIGVYFLSHLFYGVSPINFGRN